MEQTRKKGGVNLSAKPLPSFYDIPGREPVLVLFSTVLVLIRFSSLCSFGQRERRPAGAAADPGLGPAPDPTDPDRAPRPGGETFLEGQRKGRPPLPPAWLLTVTMKLWTNRLLSVRSGRSLRITSAPSWPSKTA